MTNFTVCISSAPLSNLELVSLVSALAAGWAGWCLNYRLSLQKTCCSAAVPVWGPAWCLLPVQGRQARRLQHPGSLQPAHCSPGCCSAACCSVWAGQVTDHWPRPASCGPSLCRSPVRCEVRGESAAYTLTALSPIIPLWCYMSSAAKWTHETSEMIHV